VTESEIVNDVNPVQNTNAKSPIDVTELGIVNDVTRLQPLKEELPMAVTGLPLKSAGMVIAPLRPVPIVVAPPSKPVPIDALFPINVKFHVILPTVNVYTVDIVI
jgi:hypothetical protein